MESQNTLGGVSVDVRSMLDAGVHFGHQTQRWNPKMAQYIYGERNGIHIINLDQSYQLWERARKAVHDIVSRGGSVLFVGTKRQARDIVREQAARCGSYSVTSRWLGGMLTNFQTIKNSIDRMRKMEDLLEKSGIEGSDVKISKKEKLTISRHLEKLSDNLGGIREMKRLPDAIFVIDVTKEEIAVAEAWKLKIPVIALVDTNASPDNIDYPIPANDDATRAIRLFASALADTINEARAVYRARIGDRGGDSADGGGAKIGREHKKNGAAHAAEPAIEQGSVASVG